MLQETEKIEKINQAEINFFTKYYLIARVLDEFLIKKYFSPKIPVCSIENCYRCDEQSSFLVSKLHCLCGHPVIGHCAHINASDSIVYAGVFEYCSQKCFEEAHGPIDPQFELFVLFNKDTINQV